MHEIIYTCDQQQTTNTLREELVFLSVSVKWDLHCGLIYDIHSPEQTLERCEYWRLSDSKGKPPGVVGWWPSRAVTFIENHDTGSTQVGIAQALLLRLPLAQT